MREPRPRMYIDAVWREPCLGMKRLGTITEMSRTLCTFSRSICMALIVETRSVWRDRPCLTPTISTPRRAVTNWDVSAALTSAALPLPAARAGMKGQSSVSDIAEKTVRRVIDVCRCWVSA